MCQLCECLWVYLEPRGRIELRTFTLGQRLFAQNNPAGFEVVGACIAPSVGMTVPIP